MPLKKTQLLDVGWALPTNLCPIQAPMVGNAHPTETEWVIEWEHLTSS